MVEIKNVVLDLGGVLLDVDYDRTKNAFINLGFENFTEMYSQYTADEVFSKLETGHISPEAFYEVMLKAAPKNTGIGDIEFAWNAMLLKFRKSTLDFLLGLKQKYPLYLLSNTNAIHLAAFELMLQQQTGYTSLDVFFNKIFYSHIVGLRKPGEEIFNFILEEQQMQAEETLFIDDSFPNTDTAKRMGFQTVLLSPGQRVELLPVW